MGALLNMADRENDGVSQLRVPPYSAEAEQSVLGALLLDNSAMTQLAGVLSAEHFYRLEHRWLFAAIAEIIKAGHPADVVTVFEAMQREHPEDDFGGLAYLNSLEQGVPSAANIRRYAEIVAERSASRTLIANLDQACTLAWDSSRSLTDRLSDAGELLRRAALAGATSGGGAVPLLALDALRQESAGISWLVKHIIPADSVGMIFGGSGTFKSFIALDMALHICHGLPWMGRKTRKGPAIYIAAEGGAGLWPRILAWHTARGLDWRKAQLFVVPVAIDLAQDAWRIVDAAQMIGVTPELVVVDTLSQTYSGEENSANEMAAYLRAIGGRFRALWRCAVALVHHSGHAATERPRGSSAIRSNIDFLLGCFRDEKEMLATLTCIKQKDGELFDDATFQMGVQDLGLDEDGDRITQLAARHLSSSEDVQQAMEGESKAGRGGKNQLLLRLLQSGMQEKELRKAFHEDCECESPEAKRQAWLRAKAWGLKAGFFEIVEGIVIVTKARL